MRDSIFNTQIEEVINGSYDLHVHAGPDLRRERRLDSLDTARWAYEIGMAGFVLKSHDYPTAPLAQTLNRVYQNLTVTGSIVLNNSVGGINPDAVEASAQLGARVVWMPTLDVDDYSSKQCTKQAIRLINPKGRLTCAVHDVLDIVANHDLLLASGHIPYSEVLQLFNEAKSRGVKRMIATHRVGSTTIEEQRKLTAIGAYVEYSFLDCMPSVARCSPQGMMTAIHAVGLESAVVTTDFGQLSNPPAAEGMRMAIAALLEEGMTMSDVEILVKKNPLQLVQKSIS